MTSDLFKVALGPKAKPSVLQLAEHGRRALELGHLDTENEWFLRSSKMPEPVRVKTVNEAGNFDNIDLV